MNALNHSSIYVSYNKTESAREESGSKERILFEEFVLRYINKPNRKKHYKEAHMNLLFHINKFCEIKGLKKPFTNSIDMEFCEDYVDYLRTANMMQNTIKGHLEKLSAMLHKAVLFGYPINNTFEEVKVKEEEVNMVFFDRTELDRLYYFTDLTRFQQEVRDLFIIGCFTGLRYSDYSKLNETNFIDNGNQIRIKTRKTGAVVQIPTAKFVKEIIQKYGGMPRAHCVQYFNSAMKQICKKVGFNEPVLYERTVGNKIVRKTLEKWQLIGSHTARRSFATNAFMDDIPPYRIMMITGHKSESSFFRYVQITREDNAISLSNHSFFRK